MVNAVRGLSEGPHTEALQYHSTARYVAMALIWTAALPRRLRPHRPCPPRRPQRPCSFRTMQEPLVRTVHEHGRLP
jgi:hypothetical protein